MVAVIVTITGIFYYYKTPKGKWQIDALLLRLPILGTIIRNNAIVRFSRVLSTLLSTGVPILLSMEITSRVTSNVIFETTILKVRDEIMNGKDFIEPLKANGVFPNRVSEMIREHSYALDAGFGKIADFYENEVNETWKSFKSLTIPLMTILLAIILILVIYYLNY